MSAAAYRAADQVARASYGRLVAYLSVRCRDVAAAEDALGDALQAALRTWPERGVPRNPEAWLLTTSRRRLGGLARHERVRAEATPTLRLIAEAAEQASEAATVFPDERLKLLFICAHPAIDPAARAPLMLQAILGLDAARIASAFLVAPAAMGQRLVRAKTKLREAGIAFEVPEARQLPDRLEAVLEAIYAAYGSAWEDIAGADPRRRDLAEEALLLARLVVELMPAEAEARGLLALILHCEARRAARRMGGAFVPLSEQDVALWSQPMIEEAERTLATAAVLWRPGRFQLEAAIQSAHAEGRRKGAPDWEAIALLYEGLAAICPALGTLVGRAAALAEARGPAHGLAQLQLLPSEAAVRYQPYWALSAHLLGRLGRRVEAAAAYARAIGLSEDPAVRDFLLSRSRDG